MILDPRAQPAALRELLAPVLHRDTAQVVGPLRTMRGLGLGVDPDQAQRGALGLDGKL